MDNPIAIVGLGYVGLPLSLQICRKGMSIVGLDIDRFRASCDFAEVGQGRAVVICVPTPLNKDREPDISNIIATGKAIALHLRKRVLVVLESTTYPGTTDEAGRQNCRDVPEIVIGRRDGSAHLEL